MIRFALLCLCVVPLAPISAGLFGRSDLRAARRPPVGGAHGPRDKGSWIQSRQRPLFARRRQYEWQSVHALKHRVDPVSPNDLSSPSKVASKPTNPTCSQLTQSCLPQSGCCDPCTTCHCRFFKSICFCRKTNSPSETKT